MNWGTRVGVGFFPRSIANLPQTRSTMFINVGIVNVPCQITKIKVVIFNVN